MLLYRLRNISKNFIDKKVLQGVDFDVYHNDKLAIVGDNGSGKTTLIKLLIAQCQPDSGEVICYKPNIKLEYLTQQESYEEKVAEYSVELAPLTKQLGLRMEEGPLSCGEKMKLALADIWASNADVVILDEPTNHLDFQGTAWLIDQIKKYKGTVIIISHDRYFLDQTVSKTFELEHGKLTQYNGNYSLYKSEKARLQAIQLHQYESQQKRVKEIEGKIEQLKSWSQKAHNQAGKSDTKMMGLREHERKKAKKRDQQIKSNIKRLEKELEVAEVLKPKEESIVQFSFQSKRVRGKRIIEAKNIGKKFNSHELFSNSNFYITYGEKVGLVGANGTGKSTMLKVILQKESLSHGELWVSQSLKIGYLSQDDFNASERSMIEELNLVHRNDLQQARTLLVNIGLPRHMHHQSMQTLSFGEYMRVRLVKMIMEQYDVIILDEPTNHLDMKSREMLEETLQSYDGTLLIVSHDLYFLNKLCQTTLIIENGKINRYEMNYEQYLQKKNNSENSEERDREEELMRIQNRLNSVVSQLSFLKPGDEEYLKLDEEFHQLTKQKRVLQ
ncbi:ABC-F family ATP-binding cassette domain-containing protein [Bacillus sp. HMF5848]|uniref:ribosomal protection-like ABC-F family protein n=1 Tax=Bacillus sp. HMF5848 TaxID=2495421 RepID=UPI000F770741|nr:ABC-F family ATP-binding cassette domain-containing protein [Bacillus sp. HMF5848]RSK26040.1 ABC-F family ATP-binding cassette domain-containing protein [Bacillus sp. HMF5848]